MAPTSPKATTSSPWWKFQCLPICGKNGKEKLESPTVPPTPDFITMTCGSCQTAQSVANSLSAFICISCHKVNRIVRSGDGGRRLSTAKVDGTTELYSLARVSSSVFEPEDPNAPGSKYSSIAIPQATSTTSLRGGSTLPQCNVCMDGVGDMVLLPCAHGAICEACAKHIAQNMSVGGAHCPRCREPISRLVRISEMYLDMAKGVPVVVNTGQVKKTPPKVPPPPGQHKAKKSEGEAAGGSNGQTDGK